MVEKYFVREKKTKEPSPVTEHNPGSEEKGGD
jgi:hypothetical protein